MMSPIIADANSIKERKKIGITGPLWKKSTSDGWIPLIKGQ